MALNVTDADNNFAKAIADYVADTGTFATILSTGAVAPSDPNAAKALSAWNTIPAASQGLSLSVIKSLMLALRYVLVNSPYTNIYTTATLPAATSANSGLVVMTTNGAPVVTAMTVMGVTTYTITALSGSPGPVGCNGSNWYNGVGAIVA